MDKQLGKCARCSEDLSVPVGALEEEECESCGGRFLPARGVERLLRDERKLDFDVLRALSEEFGDEGLTCPGCGQKMSTVQVKGERVDLCFGCGGLWLDAGELGRLGEGRHAEATSEETLRRLREITEEKAAARARARDAESEEQQRRDLKSVMAALGRLILVGAGVAIFALSLWIVWDAPIEKRAYCYRWASSEIGFCQVTVVHVGADDEDIRRSVSKLTIEREGHLAVSVWVAGEHIDVGVFDTPAEAQAQVDQLVLFNMGKPHSLNVDERTRGVYGVPVVGLLIGGWFASGGLRRRRRGD
jgi:Zn-finger nucleic acid-binding protein